MIRFQKSFFFLMIFFGMLCSVAWAQSFSMAAVKEKSSTSRGNVSLTPIVLETPVDSSYILGPGDFLDLTLEKNYFSVQVNPDGSIAIDECGAVVVGGLSFADAKKEILKKIENCYDPKFSYVQISKLKSVKVSVMGAVSVTGQVSLESQTRLSTLIRVVGGFLSTANKENILLIRKQDTIKINYNELMRSGDFEKDLILEQGDKIFIPFVEAGASVTFVLPNANFTLPFKEGRSIKEYYLLGIGDNIENGNFRSVKITTPDGKEKRISVPETHQYVPVAGSEILCIGQSGSDEFVYVGGAVAAMGKVPYDPDFKALDYIAASGVTPITGSWEQVRVVRGNRETLNVNATEDQIMPGDYIEIPKSTYENFKDFTMFLASLLTVLSSSFIIYMNYK